MKNNQDCEIIRNGLMDFLERRRGKFPRLFFLSNEELIGVFGAGAELVPNILAGKASQAFVTNLFEGVDTLGFQETACDLECMRSKDGEELKLVKGVGTRGLPVDTWLKQFEASMVLTVKDALFLTFE
jgi:dynein heavy chain